MHVFRLLKSLTDGHMLSEGNLASLFDELIGLHAVVEVQLDLFKSLEHASLVINGFQAKLRFQVLPLVGLSLGDLLIAILGLLLLAQVIITDEVFALIRVF